MATGKNTSSQLKLAVFDLDGTLIRPRSSWKYLHEKLGTWEMARANAELFYDKKITWEEWANRDAKLWKGTATDEVERIARKCPITRGARETICRLGERDFAMAIISGGLSFFAERVGQELKIQNVFANKLSSKDGILTGEVVNLVTQTNKCELLSLLLERLGLSLRQTVAIGDDFTMIPMFKIVGQSIAFNPFDLDVSKSACITVNSPSLLDILPYILSNPAVDSDPGKTWIREKGQWSLKNAVPKYSLVDLFAGPGGLSLGFRMSGFFEPTAAVEFNPKVAETYRTNLGVKVIEAEIGKVKPKQLADALLKLTNESGYKAVDAIIGGPPCRPFTTANKGGTRWEKVREQNKGKNSDIDHPDWLCFSQIVDALQPRVVVAENVLGFRNHDDVFLKFLDRLKNFGYATSSRELQAHCFGIPQNRKRLFIAGVKDFTGDKDSILPLNPKVRPADIVSVKNAISDLPELSNDSTASQFSKYRRVRPARYQSLMRNGCQVLYDHVTHSVHPVMAERFKYIPSGYSLRKAWAEGKIPEASMQSQYVRGNVRKGFSQNTLENMHSNIYRRLKWEDLSCTITHIRKTVLIHPLQNRLISVREAARLQSFPDWFRFSGSISQQYQQIADAVPPFLALAIASHLAELLISMSKPTTL
jgi:DNA (cytosine-5)-methyltransferase 1